MANVSEIHLFNFVTFIFLASSTMPLLNYLMTKITGCEPKTVDISIVSNFFESAFGRDWPFAHLNHLVFPTAFLVGISVVIRHWVLQDQASLPWSFVTFIGKFGAWFYCVRLIKFLLVDTYKLNPDNEG